MTRIECPCCKRNVSESRWTDEGVCRYCLHCVIGGPCTRGQERQPADVNGVGYNADYQYAAGYQD